jgi:hypothetical protein
MSRFCKDVLALEPALTDHVWEMLQTGAFGEPGKAAC